MDGAGVLTVLPLSLLHTWAFTHTHTVALAHTWTHIETHKHQTYTLSAHTFTHTFVTVD